MRSACNFPRSFKIGDCATVIKTITEKDLVEFGRLSGDINPIHFPSDKSKAVVHGAFLNSLVSGVIGTKLPGPGTVVVSQNLNFPNKCFINDVITIKVELVELRKLIKVKFTCDVEQEKKVVMYGDAKLLYKNL